MEVEEFTPTEVVASKTLKQNYNYLIKKGRKVQFSLMNQTSDTWLKNQLQFNFHQTF